MESRDFAQELIRRSDSPEPHEPAYAVIVYDDLAAGKRAMRMLTSLTKGLGDGFEFQPLPWPFEMLADVGWGEFATSEAVSAEILIISTSGPNPLPAAVGQWAEVAIGRKQGTPTAVIALFGPEENPDGADSGRLVALQTLARRAGLEFFAPSPRHEVEPGDSANPRNVTEGTVALEEPDFPKPVSSCPFPVGSTWSEGKVLVSQLNN